ncbi:hypothetical protein LXL04_029016 [Taraxacum kok-saghyz]
MRLTVFSSGLTVFYPIWSVFGSDSDPNPTQPTTRVFKPLNPNFLHFFENQLRSFVPSSTAISGELLLHCDYRRPCSSLFLRRSSFVVHPAPAFSSDAIEVARKNSSDGLCIFSIFHPAPTHTIRRKTAPTSSVVHPAPASSSGRHSAMRGVIVVMEENYKIEEIIVDRNYSKGGEESDKVMKLSQLLLAPLWHRKLWLESNFEFQKVMFEMGRLFFLPENGRNTAVRRSRVASENKLCAGEHSCASEQGDDGGRTTTEEERRNNDDGWRRRKMLEQGGRRRKNVSPEIAILSTSFWTIGIPDFESVPDLEKSMYKVIDGCPCIRLLQNIFLRWRYDDEHQKKIPKQKNIREKLRTTGRLGVISSK